MNRFFQSQALKLFVFVALTWHACYTFSSEHLIKEDHYIDNGVIRWKYEIEGLTFDLDILKYAKEKEWPFDELRKRFNHSDVQKETTILCPVEIAILFSPEEIHFGEKISIRISAKNIGECDIDHFSPKIDMAPNSQNIAVWISHDQLKDIHPCLKNIIFLPKKNESCPIVAESVSLPKDVEILLFEESFYIPSMSDLEFPFWKSWRELPDEQKSECSINLRIQHPRNSNVYNFSHAITICPIPESEIALREERYKEFRERSNFQINTVWKGDVESIPSAYKEWVHKRDDSKQSSK